MSTYLTKSNPKRGQTMRDNLGIILMLLYDNNIKQYRLENRVNNQQYNIKYFKDTSIYVKDV